MSGWSDWETLRCQVAVCGRVLDADGRAVANATVRIDAQDAAFPREPFRSRADGMYWFMDLPSGEYHLAAEVAPGAQGETRVSVSWDDANNVLRAEADLHLAPGQHPNGKGQEVRNR
jgi:hypothetical protein